MTSTMTSPSDRYIVVEGSETGHCCFHWSVIDVTKTTKTASGYELRFPVCECFEKADADAIAAALNAKQPSQRTP